MSLGLSSLIVASTLVLHPFSTNMLASAPEPVPDPSWDEPEEPVADPATDPARDPAEALAPAPEPAPAPAATPEVVPVAVPGMLPVTRPTSSKGTGLIITAGIVGGLAWLTTIGRMRAITRCTDAIATGEISASVGQCIFKSGTALLLLTPAGWMTNGATYGLAPGAGMVRGKYDGIAAAWDGAPERTPAAYIGSGAALLGLGVIGRVFTMFTFDNSIAKCVGGADACRNALVLHYLGSQISSSSIATGAGLLAYGLSYKKNRDGETDRRKAAGLAHVRLSPQLGWAYNGLSLSGRF